jgi:hypothetical protein
VSLFGRKRSDVEQYLDFLHGLTDGMEPEHLLVTNDSERPPVWSFVFRGWIDEENLSAFTYGLSSGDHDDWKLGKPELVISVDSPEKEWALTVGFIAKKLRGVHSFQYGSTIKLGHRITSSSAMTAFLMFAPSILDERERVVKLLDRTINFVQLYPIYEEEIEVIQLVGMDRWFSQEYDPYSVVRKPRMRVR